MLLQYLRLGTRSVAIAEQSDKEWMGVVDLIETDLQYFATFGLLLCNTPPKINLYKRHITLGSLLSQSRKNLLHQVIAFGLHILKC